MSLKALSYKINFLGPRSQVKAIATFRFNLTLCLFGILLESLVKQ